MAAITQIGQAVDVGFNGIVYSDFVMEDASEALVGDISARCSQASRIRDSRSVIG